MSSVPTKSWNGHQKQAMKIAVLFILSIGPIQALSPILASTAWLKPSTPSALKSLGNTAISTCNDGVCELNSRSNDSSLHQMVLDDWKSADGFSLPGTSTESPINPEKLADIKELTSGFNTTADISTLTDMGWSSEEAHLALSACNNDIAQAADYLLAKDEEMDLRMTRLDELVKSGWQQQAAFAALEANEGNKTAAEEWLLKEEESVHRSFSIAVEDMVAHGWSEYVAREALLSQFIMNQRAAKGENVTVSPEILNKIRPTLRKIDENIPNYKIADAASNGASSKTDIATLNNNADSVESTQAAKVEPNLPTPAKKEDVVFQVTAASFQSVILDSPVPVVLDVYADWCEPCKQLGPVLEEAAIKAGGAFRLAKVNSDQERSLAQALGVQSLPTVFTVDKGKFNDRIVGVPPREQLQKYLIRAITGGGERVQGKEFSEKELDQTGEQIASLAGAASLTFKRKEQIHSQVEAALDLPGAFADGSNSALTMGMKLALSLVQKCRKNIRDDAYRVINKTSPQFQSHITTSPAAQKLLQAAGFVPTKDQKLHLTHSNPAILTLIAQRVDEVVRDRRFSKMRSPSSAILPSRHTARSASVQTPALAPIKASVGSSEPKGAATLGTNKPSDVHNIELGTDARAATKEMKKSAPNASALPSAESVAGPLSSRPHSTSAPKSSTKPKKSPTTAPKPGKVNTVFSTGIIAPSKKKFNEYFGGDSTVVSAGDEEESNNEEEGNKEDK